MRLNTPVRSLDRASVKLLLVDLACPHHFLRRIRRPTHACSRRSPLPTWRRGYDLACGLRLKRRPLGVKRMADNITYEGFLRDVGGYIRERAFEAKRQREQFPGGSEERLLHTGRTIAFSEVLSILQQTLAGFDLPFDSMQLGELDPDRDLL